MRLKQLELIGFKSFVHRTVLDFPAGVTAVVGPNGCGKSNVVDAIRWVLGEQSPKHLRGESMEDVVFKGNDRVAATGMAQVSLTFENEPSARPLSELDLDISTVPAHFRDLAEITVTRRYFRSGESEYFINKTACRLKDITELFLGTGVGSKAYAIIEQGRVEQLINAKPEDRRLFIEEAAGTTLYRSRKLAAERKMERARENLLRLNDVLRELERQIQYLHRLARKAEQYRALQAEIRELDLALAAAQWRQLAAGVAELEAQLTALRAEEATAADVLARLEDDRRDALAAQAAAEEEGATARAAAAAFESECSRLQQRAELLDHEARERERRVGRLEAETDALTAQREALGNTIAEQERACADEASFVAADEAELSRTAAELAAARQQAATLSVELDGAKNAEVTTLAKAAESRNALAAAIRRRDDAQRTLEKLSAETAAASEQLAVLDAAVEARRTEVAGVRERLRAAEGEKEQRAERVRVLAEERRRREREIIETQRVLVQLRSRVESLAAIQRNYEGYQRGVRSILLAAQPADGVLGVVGDVIDVPQEHERAVAAALGERLQYVIVKQEDDGVGAVATLRRQESGRGSFIPLAPRPLPIYGPGAGSLNGTTRRMLDLVHFDEQYRRVAEALLGEVVLVPDIDSGMALWRKNGVHVTMVTPDGDVIDANGVITGGSERPVEEEIMARRREASELAARIAACEDGLREAREGAERVEQGLDEEERVLKGIDRDTHTLTVELVAREKDLERLESERPRWIDRLEVSRFESAAATAERNDGHAAIAQIEEVLQTLRGEQERLETVRRTCQGAVGAAADAVETLSAALTAVKVRTAERRQRYQAAVAALAGLRGQCEDLARRAAACADELRATGEEAERLAATAQAAAEQHAAHAARRQSVEDAIATARRLVESAAQAVARQDQLLAERRVERDRLRQECNHHEITLAETRLRLEHVAATVRERYATEVTEAPASEIGSDDPAALQRLESLRAQVARIGEVNVGAIDELRELEERAGFLRQQKEDLERSLADLERTIQRLNRASRTRFAETFAAVNEKFQAVLPRLFRGGEGRLVLTDEHNLLETGVEIVVRPPGKRLDTVSLLSGGEKALVAVSLIFSLFMINPTPFCFLDEVDAPLDDANIGRFTSQVREMSERSQFIVITHNKRTMQAANVLYGVTMEEPGISKVISVAMH